MFKLRVGKIFRDSGRMVKEQTQEMPREMEETTKVESPEDEKEDRKRKGEKNSPKRKRDKGKRNM